MKTNKLIAMLGLLRQAQTVQTSTLCVSVDCPADNCEDCPLEFAGNAGKQHLLKVLQSDPFQPAV